MGLCSSIVKASTLSDYPDTGECLFCGTRRGGSVQKVFKYIGQTVGYLQRMYTTTFLKMLPFCLPKTERSKQGNFCPSCVLKDFPI